VNVWQLTRAVRRYAAGGDIAPMPYEEAEALILATLPPARRAAALTDLKAKLRRTPRSGWETLPGGSLAPGDRRILALLNSGRPSWSRYRPVSPGRTGAGR